MSSLPDLDSKQSILPKNQTMRPIKYIMQSRAALHFLYKKRLKYFKDLRHL